MLNRRSIILASIAALALSHRIAAAQTADDIVNKHLAAMGGRDALSKITTRRVTGTVQVSTPAGDISGPFELDSKAPNKSRLYFKLDLTSLGAGELTVQRKFDGTKGWSLDSMQGDTEITGSQLEALKNGTFPSPLLDYKQAGTTLELLPAQQFQGKNAIVMKVQPKTGPSVTLWFDPDTFLIIKSSTILTVPEAGGDLEQISELSDYRTVDGVKVPFSVKIINATQTVTVTTTKVEHNIDLPDSLFVK